MEENKNVFEAVIGTTGGVIGQKVGLVAGEIVTQGAAAGIGVGVGLGHSPLGRLITSVPKHIVGAATDPRTKDLIARAGSKLGSAANAISNNKYVAEVADAVKNDASRLKVNFSLIDGKATDEEPELIESEETVEERTIRLRREEDEAAAEAGCAPYDHDEMIDAYDEN